MKKKEFRVFFSWQSDSPKSTNSGAIRKALKVAKLKLEEQYPKLSIVIDEATRDTSGSPNIALSIFRKIEKSDMLVSDITTINPGAARACPNPNVVYELGYAMALLGENRVVMLFNKAYGTFPQDLPFDFVQNRTSPYKLSEADPTSAKNNLVELLICAIQAVIEQNPKTPEQLRGLSPEKMQHDNDVKNIKWLLTNIHIPTLDEQIAELPRVLTVKCLWFWEGFNGVVQNNRFSLYDKVLEGHVKALHAAWHTALKFDAYYHEAPGGKRYIFTNPGDAPLPPDKERVWEQINDAKHHMAQAFTALLQHVRTHYIEVKIDKRSDQAWRQYIDEIHATTETVKSDKKKPRRPIKSKK